MKRFISMTILFLASFGCFAQNTYYVSPSGNNSNTGDTIASAWLTLQYAVNQLSAGDILYMRGGSYYESGVAISVSGTATDPIQIKAYPGEFPILDNRIPAFLNSANNSEWQVYDTTLNIYESTQAYSNGWKAYGFLEELGEFYHLVTYKSYAALSAATEDWTASGETYVGPGVYFNDSTGRIYIKLERASATAVFQSFTTPIVSDPRQNIIHLGLQERGLRFDDNASHIEIEGLTIHSFANCLRVFSGSDLTFKNMSIWAGQYGLLLFDATGSNYLIDSVDFYLHLPDWVARGDMKIPPSPASNIKLTAMVTRGVNVEISHCNFYGTHDAVVVNSTSHDVAIHHNYMEATDDAAQISSNVYNVEFSYNMVIGAGPSHQGSPNMTPFIGADYYHHNIIDFSTPIFFARNDPDSLLKAKYRNNPLKGGGIFGSHGPSKAVNADPWKIYNNTLIGRSRVSNSDHKFDNWIGGNGSVLHEFYNNIAILVDDWFFYRGSYVDRGEEIFDYNIYHTEADMEFRRRLNEDPNLNYATLNDFLSSPEFVTSQSYYPPGWDANSRVGDPLLDSNYYPDPNGMAATGALDLSSKGWPGADGAPYIGALPPPIAEPVIEGCPSVINIMVNNIGCTGIATWTEPTLFGNSIGISMTASYSPGDTFSLGTTTVKYIANNGTITDSCSFDVVVISDLQVISDSISNVLCEGAENGAAYISVVGDTAGYTYDWDNDGIGDFDDDQNPINLAGGTHNIIVKDTNGCIVTDSVTITEPTAKTGIFKETICEGDSLVVNGTTYNTTVIGATEIFTSVGLNNCDSTVTINLTVEDVIDTTIIETDNVLTANEVDAQYQWIDCFNGNEIVGETNSSYTATVSGTYAVAITKGSCTETSTCISIINVGIFDNPLETVFQIYPNPTEDKFTIEFEETENIRISIMNVIGEEIYASTCSCIGKTRFEISLANYSQGLYFVKLESSKYQRTVKLIKE